jgi:hypothetical protein
MAAAALFVRRTKRKTIKDATDVRMLGSVLAVSTET